MINIQKLIEEENHNGYQGNKASAKVCQDIVLKALSIGPFSTRYKDVYDMYYLKDTVN